jgi:hypothetical protein
VARLSARTRLDALGIDLEGSLLDEPRFLGELAFLGALHAELRGEVGPEAAEAVLLQLGFARGLFDAGRIVRDGLAEGIAPAPATPLPARLPMRLAPRADGRGGLALEGSWPERAEARAVASALGPAGAPACAASAGYTAGWLSGVLGADVLAVEVACAACGAAACRFVAREPGDWLARNDRRAASLLEALPFAELRELVGRRLAALPARAPGDGFEPGSPAIHVWGPVMVVPFSGADESLRALELVSREREARDVRVVVVDLSGAIVDDGFGALALERILDAIAGLGAEPILAGVSPLSMGAVSELERAHALVRKDLPEAIAAAFQIAEAQRGAA